MKETLFDKARRLVPMMESKLAAQAETTDEATINTFRYYNSMKEDSMMFEFEIPKRKAQFTRFFNLYCK